MKILTKTEKLITQIEFTTKSIFLTKESVLEIFKKEVLFESFEKKGGIEFINFKNSIQHGPKKLLLSHVKDNILGRAEKKPFLDKNQFSHFQFTFNEALWMIDDIAKDRKFLKSIDFRITFFLSSISNDEKVKVLKFNFKKNSYKVSDVEKYSQSGRGKIAYKNFW